MQYTFSIFNAEIGRLRKQWLFLDLLGAEKMTGQVDNCLFSLHRPQSISRATAAFPPNHHVHPYETESRFDTRTSRFRIDGVSIDHLQTPADTGALAWITSGRADVVADVRLPVERDDVDLGTVVKEIVGNLEKEVETAAKRAQQRERERDGTTIGGNISERPALARPALEAPSPRPFDEDRSVVEEVGAAQGRQKKVQKVVIDMDIRFKDVKASLPMYTTDLSYVNNALVRPIVAFLNANRTLIPVKSRVELDLVGPCLAPPSRSSSRDV